jgi:hypothetical protein
MCIHVNKNGVGNQVTAMRIAVVQCNTGSAERYVRRHSRGSRTVQKLPEICLPSDKEVTTVASAQRSAAQPARTTYTRACETHRSRAALAKSTTRKADVHSCLAGTQGMQLVSNP